MKYIFNHVTIHQHSTGITGDDGPDPDIVSSARTPASADPPLVDGANGHYCVAKPMIHKGAERKDTRSANSTHDAHSQQGTDSMHVDGVYLPVSHVLAKRTDYQKVFNSAKDETIRIPSRQVTVQHLEHAGSIRTRVLAPTHNVISCTDFEVSKIQCTGLNANHISSEDIQPLNLISVLTRSLTADGARGRLDGDSDGDRNNTSTGDNTDYLRNSALVYERKSSLKGAANRSAGKSFVKTTIDQNQDNFEDDNDYTYTVASTVKYHPNPDHIDDIRIFEVKNAVQERRRGGQALKETLFDVIKIDPPAKGAEQELRRSFMSGTTPVEKSRYARPKSDNNFTFNKTTAVREETPDSAAVNVTASYAQCDNNEENSLKGKGVAFVSEAPVENPVMQHSAIQPDNSDANDDMDICFQVTKANVINGVNADRPQDGRVTQLQVERIAKSRQHRIEHTVPLLRSEAVRVAAPRAKLQEEGDLRCFVLTFVDIGA